MKGKKGGGESAPVSVADESWVFWQYNAVGNMRGVSERLGVPVALVSPEFIRWQMDAYFEIKRRAPRTPGHPDPPDPRTPGPSARRRLPARRPAQPCASFSPRAHRGVRAAERAPARRGSCSCRDLEELGLGPFLCPTAVSSGIHGVLMATALCSQARGRAGARARSGKGLGRGPPALSACPLGGCAPSRPFPPAHGVGANARGVGAQVDLFGYSYSYSQLMTRPGHNSGRAAPPPPLPHRVTSRHLSVRRTQP